MSDTINKVKVRINRATSLLEKAKEIFDKDGLDASFVDCYSCIALAKVNLEKANELIFLGAVK